MHKGEVIYRHSAAVRVTHWISALVLLVLLMSGLQIFNAHPALYLGEDSDFENPIMAMGAVEQGEARKGVTTIFGYAIPTTGVFGLGGDADSGYDARGFPWWSTLPGHRNLAMGRRWHFFFAWLFLLNGLAYLLWSLASGHLRRDLAPSRKELGHIGASILEHARLKFPKGDEARRYNVLQKLAYLTVALLLLPLMLLTGLAMSPGMDAAFPVLLDMFGGRQSARTVHFISATGIFLFVVVHLVMVLLSGRLEQSSLDDHRPLRDRAGGGKIMSVLNRRGFLARGLAGASTALLGGCDALSDQDWVKRVLESGETLTRITQEALLTPQALAREYGEADLSRAFKANGSINPDDPAYVAHAKNAFADWKLSVGGLVETPLELSLAELRAMPSRTQITRHDCVEGWSCIGKWRGVRLGALLARAQLKPDARYLVFYCADALGSTGTEADKYYESIGLADAFHEQTILAYEMNDQTLPIAHGAPLRLRVERQLGYKMAKYVMRIEAVGSLAGIRGGRGGFWEDLGYEWYAGI